ncbi:MAG: hypothetical protein L3J71_15210 [Victivallaceae bacterium]|nr:hypothetical protein [Victivallaceae bacterium]
MLKHSKNIFKNMLIASALLLFIGREVIHPLFHQSCNASCSIQGKQQQPNDSEQVHFDINVEHIECTICAGLALYAELNTSDISPNSYFIRQQIVAADRFFFVHDNSSPNKPRAPPNQFLC